MSGHSKWSTIKRQKGAADIKRSAQFTKLANAIVIAVRQGGGPDAETNFKLRLAIDKARSYNMPKDNIERAISKAQGGQGGGDLHESLYEGFVPGGAGILIEAVTDNKQRTVSEVKNILDKNGGTLGGQGSVSYLFKRVGEIAVTNSNKTPDEIFDMAISIDSDDYAEEEGHIIFYVNPSNLAASKKLLEENGMTIVSAELVFKPSTTLEIPEEAKSKVLSLIEKLEDLDDVHGVFVNASL